MTKPRSGRQEPTTSFVLPYQITDGETAAQLYELTGRTALEWQKNLLYDILAKNEDGKWIHTTFGYSVPRQNGKGEILIMRELYGLAIGERIMHTAHLTSTSHKAWERLRDILDILGIPYHSIKAKGQEIIELRDGGRVEFRTRTTTGGLGETYDLLIIDDLGTEMVNSFTATQLFNCVNERILGKKHTIISTNLSLKQLQDNYSERIFSRIANKYTFIRLLGNDIRMTKKLEEN